jgi:hypothetical protein
VNLALPLALGEMPGWLNNILTKAKVDKLWFGKMEGWQNSKLIKCHVDEIVC